MKIIKDNSGVAEASSLSQIKADFPNVSFRSGLPDSQINPLGYYRVQPTAPPIYDPAIEKIALGPPIKNGVIWEESWVIVALTAGELEVLSDRADTEAIKLDPLVKALITATPTGIENYISTNVTDLATAKDVLTILAKAISALGKREFR